MKMDGESEWNEDETVAGFIAGIRPECLIVVESAPGRMFHVTSVNLYKGGALTKWPTLTGAPGLTLGY